MWSDLRATRLSIKNAGPCGQAPPGCSGKRLVVRMSAKSPLHEMLAIGDLRSDGLSREAAALVLQNPHLIPELVDVLLTGSPAARGHAAEAIERVSRSRQQLVSPYMVEILPLAAQDGVAMVRWHIGMLLTNQVVSALAAKTVVPVLIGQLSDRSAFVRSWAISGLCIIARRYPGMKRLVLRQLRSMDRDPMISVRHRAQTAIRVLLDDSAPIPATWAKATSRDS